MKFYITTLTIFAVLTTSHAQKCRIGDSSQQAGTVVDPALVNGAAAAASSSPSVAAQGSPQVSSAPSAVVDAVLASPAPSSTMSQYPLPSQYPGQGTGVGRGPTGKCLYGRNYCGWSIRDLHTYEDLKAVYCSSNLCPYQHCGNGATCNPTEEDVFQSVYQCDDLTADYEGESVFFLGACATSGWVCVNPEPHCTTPRRARIAVRGLHY